MQRNTLLTSILAGAGALLLATAAPAAELGDIAVRSYIGQPLAADIELVQLAPDEVSALQVRLAQQDVYRGANISMNPALGSLHMAVVRRDGRQFLHLTTTRAIDAEYVHLFLELSAAGRQDVRAATVWLQADPNPAPPPLPPVTAAQAALLARAERAVQATAPAPAPSTAPVAPVAAPVRDRTRPAPMPAAHESEVGEPGGLRSSAGSMAPVRRPAPLPARRPTTDKTGGGEADQAGGAVPLGVAQALLPLPPLPLPKGVKRPAAPAACAPSGMSAKECAALDTHSMELSSKLVELEGRVKLLQGALGAKGGAASAAASAASGVQAGAASGHGGAASVHGNAAAGQDGAASAAWAGSAPVMAATASSGAHASGSADGAGHGAAQSAAASAPASASASAAAGGGESASAEADVPVKKVRVLPKLKYKKEKPPEPAASNWPLIAGGAGALALLLGAGGYFYLRKKRGSGPLKIWQGFRKKKPAAEGETPMEAPPLHEVTPESMMEKQ
ncbi:hypothetical protein HUX88_21290 [Duganella sp. BJB1802]|uniref:type IV pilus assembly protein FimV n=1 Tax=Duganella sp. BJB1802 TaxID=2744575 RepID=UPI001594B051|nr:hypothetical protein [Duganella sp. BJB1802]NVD73065.1 hypothetical protein [Duganella sp. BJB1802]